MNRTTTESVASHLPQSIPTKSTSEYGRYAVETVKLITEDFIS